METEILILVGVLGIIIGGFINQLIYNFVDRRKTTPPVSNQETFVKVDGEEADTSYRLNNNQRETTQRLIQELNNWLGLSQVVKSEVDAEPPDKEEDTEDTTPRLSLNPVTTLVRALQADVKKSQLPTVSIVSQINDILQANLKHAPNIKDPVCLMEWPGLGMVVMIGLEKFENVDDVPDEDIKTAIRAAVKEWEQQGQRVKT